MNIEERKTVEDLYNSFTKLDKKKVHLDLYASFKVLGALAVSYHQILTNSENDFENILEFNNLDFKFKIGQAQENHYLHFIDKSGRTLFGVYWQKNLPYTLHPRTPLFMHLAFFLSQNIYKFMEDSGEKYCAKN